MDKPDVDSIEGLSPAISIDQKTTSRNPRSTVGTVTEIYDYLRLLWARIGKPHCSNCGRPIAAQSAEQIIDQVMALAEGTRFMVLAPVVRGRKGEYGKQLRGAARRGLHAREGRRRAAPARGGDRARQEVQARHRGRGRPAGDAAATCASGWPTRSRPRSRWPTGSSRSRPCRATAGDRSRRSRERFACLHCGISMPELEPRIVLVQLAARRLPALHRPRLADGDRPGAGGAGPVAVAQRGRDPAVVQRARRATTSRSRRRSPSATRSTSTPRGRTCRGAAGPASCTAPTATSSTSRTATGWAASART